MPNKPTYIIHQVTRAQEMRNRALQANFNKNKNIYKTETNVFPLLNVEGVNDNNILKGEYVDGLHENEKLDNTVAYPIGKNNNNIIDSAIPIDEKKSWTNWFTPKARHIKPSNEVVSLTPIYKSNFSAGKSKKNKKTKKNKKIKKTRKLNKRRK